MDLTQVFAQHEDSAQPYLVPSAFESAWSHVLMAFILLANDLPRLGCDHLHAASRMIDRGNIALADQLRPIRARDAEICPAVGMAALFIDKIARAPAVGEMDIVTFIEREVQSLVRRIPLNIAGITHTW